MPITGMWRVAHKNIDGAIKQLDQDSDRAVAIVAATIVESCLTGAIQSRLIVQNAIVSDMFRPTGALGSFEAKINLAFLIGILSAEAHRDLINMKKIRNEFAHRLELESFDAQRIRDLCRSLTLVEKYVASQGEQISTIKLLLIPEEESGLFSNDQKSADERVSPIEPPLFCLQDRTNILMNPRSRFIYSAMVFNILLCAVPKRQPPHVFV